MKCTDEKFINALSQFKVKCKCGHVMTIVNKMYYICPYCGRKVYRSKRDEFLDKLKKVIK